MFFATDLLSKKNALGQIWLIANGSKVPRNKIAGLSVASLWYDSFSPFSNSFHSFISLNFKFPSTACLHRPSPNFSLSLSRSDQVNKPEAPLALRLSGILIGGIVIVFHRQQVYLHQDAQLVVVRTEYGDDGSFSAPPVHFLLSFRLKALCLIPGAFLFLFPFYFACAPTEKAQRGLPGERRGPHHDGRAAADRPAGEGGDQGRETETVRDSDDGFRTFFAPSFSSCRSLDFYIIQSLTLAPRSLNTRSDKSCACIPSRP